MNFNPHIPVQYIIALVAVSTLIMMWSVLKVQSYNKFKKVVIVVLRLLVLSILTVILLNPVKVVERKEQIISRKNVVMLDQSTSMNVGEGETRWQQMVSDVFPLMSQQMKTPVEWVMFDSLASSIDTIKQFEQWQPIGQSTRIVESIEHVLNRKESISNLIICTDGQTENKARLNAAIALARTKGTAISVMGYGKNVKQRNGRIDNIDVATHARPNEVIKLNAILHFEDLEGELFNVKLLKGSELLKQTRGKVKNGQMNVEMLFNSGQASSNYHLQLNAFHEELTTVDNNCFFYVKVSDPRIRVLYMEGTNSNYRKNRVNGASWPAYRFIEQSCREMGRIDVDSYVVDRQAAVGGQIYHVKTRKRGYPKSRKDLYKYDVVICSDINRTIFSDAQLQWTRDLIEKRGGGLCMIGGNTSFGSGGWDKTTWEKIIPVDMSGFGRGQMGAHIKPSIPVGSLDHPIWQLGATKEQSLEIIDQHPPFRGTNIVRRAKPGATVLAYWRERKNMPLICVQSYGKGRSMAFTSDAAGGWGEGYQNGWGPNGRTNKYYRKFWANSVLWLAQNSIRNKENQFRISSDKLNYRSEEQVKLTAQFEDKNEKFNVVARLLNSKGNNFKLKEQERGVFTGFWKVPQQYRKAKAQFEIKAVNKRNDNTFCDTISVNIVALNKEFARPNPDFEVLQELMSMTGGKNIRSAEELETLLNQAPEQLAGDKRQAKIPMWSSWLIWLLIVLLWTIEWSVRKWG
ncbi:hypothetical protein EMN47_04220 [Prolixibacteraceae bacterium JC049]|nr:hypothetical protein [Prolixibacteraceae bacterium JC049]